MAAGGCRGERSDMNSMAIDCDSVPVSCLRRGEKSRITQLIGRHDSCHRLREMGLRPGTEVEMIQSGEPCIVRVGGTRLCFRAGDECGVLVQRPDVA